MDPSAVPRIPGLLAVAVVLGSPETWRMTSEGARVPQYSWFKNCSARLNLSYTAARRQAAWLLVLYLAAGMASASAQTGSAAAYPTGHP